MLRGLARLLLTGVLAISMVGTLLTAARIAADPRLSPYVTASSVQIRAATEAMLAQSDTPAILQARIEVLLTETPRNWLALGALTDLASERAIDLPPEVLDTLRIRREADHGFYMQARSCANCGYDPARCSLNQVMICQAPIALTPIGDLAGVARAGLAFASGSAVDQIDLALSIVGLGATVAVMTSGGTSYTVKAGASLAKLARRMGRLSPRLVKIAGEAASNGLRWADLPAVRSVDDLAGAIHPAAFAPLTETLTELAHLTAATDATTALHLLPLVEEAADARRLANAAQALGPKLVGRAEVLGKARLLRATIRLSKTAWTLGAGLVGLFISVAGMLTGMLQDALLQQLRKYEKATA